MLLRANGLDRSEAMLPKRERHPNVESDADTQYEQSHLFILLFSSRKFSIPFHCGLGLTKRRDANRSMDFSGLDYKKQRKLGKAAVLPTAPAWTWGKSRERVRGKWHFSATGVSRKLSILVVQMILALAPANTIPSRTLSDEE